MRLLIAEDELDLAEALTVFFEKNHFTVDAVHNGFDAYEYAAAGGYDKHDRDKAPTDGGPGGKGGGAVNLTVWHGGNNLVLSTACKLELTSGSAGGSFPAATEKATPATAADRPWNRASSTTSWTATFR